MFFRSSPFRFFSIFLLALIIFSFAGKLYAQLDPTFGTNGVVRTFLGGEGTTIATFVLPDGKILIVASEKISSQSKTVFIKYNSDGTLDSSYGTNGKIQLPIPYFTPTSGKTLNAARQPDGKIVIAGYDLFSFARVPLVARFNEDGTLDTTFAQGNGISRPNPTSSGGGQFNSILLQPDGKILLAGSADEFLFLMRYHSDGSVDMGLGTNNRGYVIHNSLGSQSITVGNHFYLQSSGKFIVGNLSNPAGGQRVCRFNADGTFDNSFTFLLSSGSNLIQTVRVQPDDKILVGGQISKTEILETVHLDARISRYNADGTIDTGFGNGGQVSFDTAGYSTDTTKGFQIMPDGQILVALNLGIQPNRSIYTGTWLALTRLSPNGTVNGRLLMASFSDNNVSSINIQPDGKILAATKGNVDGQPDGTVKLARAVSIPAQNYVFPSNPNFLPTVTAYRPSTNSLYMLNTSNRQVGLVPGDILASADFIGSSTTEFTYFRPSNGTWYISRAFSLSNILTIRWGAEGDIPVPADYNGDGKADPAVFRPSEGNWYIYHIADGSSSIVHWGAPGDKPVPGDYDGDGIYDRAIFRPSTGEWWILRSSDNGYSLVQLGAMGDIPVQEDYDGDGKFDIAVYRPSTGVWYRINSSDASFFAYQWGLPGDIPVPGNYDSDRKANVGVWRPANGTWYIVNADYASTSFFNLGMDGDIPIPGKY